MIDRRDLALAAASFAAFALVGEAAAANARPARRLAAARWISRHDEIADALSAGRLSQTDWRVEVESLARAIDVAQLMREVGRANFVAAGAPYGKDPRKRFVRFKDEDGRPRRLAYGVALFQFDRSNVITPHGHRNMVSAHLVVEGKIRVRTFDRVADEKGALILRPNRDEVAETGAAAAMTADSENVHWFAPRSDAAMTFDVIIDGLAPGQEAFVIEPVDIIGAERRTDGLLRAPVISFAQSAQRYASDI